MTRTSELAVRRRAASQSWSNRSATIEHMIERQGTQMPPHFISDEEMKDYEWRFMTHRGVTLAGATATTADDRRLVVPPAEVERKHFFAAGNFWELYQVYLENLGRRAVVVSIPDTPHHSLVFFARDGEMWLAQSNSEYTEGLAALRLGSGVVTADEALSAGNWVSSLTPMAPIVRTPDSFVYDRSRVFLAGSAQTRLVNIDMGYGVEIVDSGPDTRIVTTNEQRWTGNWVSPPTPMNPIIRTHAPLAYDRDRVFMAGGGQAQVVNIGSGYGVELVDSRPEPQILTAGETRLADSWVSSLTPMGPIVRTPDSFVYDQGRVFIAGGAQKELVNTGLGYGVEIADFGLGSQVIRTLEPFVDNDWAPHLDVIHYSVQIADSLDPGVGSKQQETTVVETAQIESLLTELESDFSVEPFEDGMDHEAERTLSKALRDIEAEHLLPWLRDFCTDRGNPNLAASVLRCLGRLLEPGTEAWRTRLIRDALAKGNVEIRDAAVQAVEQWGETNLASVLRLHQEELPWLQDYIQGVLQDLEG